MINLPPSASNASLRLVFAFLWSAAGLIGCGDSSSSNVDAGTSCVEDPAFCAASNAVCGSLQRPDGTCVACGRCALPLICGGSGVANQCGCTPTDCSAQSTQCGEIDDGCGSTILCGTCPADQLCLDRQCAPYIPIGQNCTLGSPSCVPGGTCCLVGTGTFCVDSPTPGVCPGELPDLITRDTSTRGSLTTFRRNFAPTDCAVSEGCLGGPGDRSLIGFGVFIENVGRKSAVLGVPSEDPSFQYDACVSHQHYHWAGMLSYTLHSVNGDGSLSAPLAENRKVSHCLEDGKALAPESPPSGGFACTGPNGRQGLTQGWGYTYEPEVDCQWIDVTDVPPGPYYLRVEVDPMNRIPEEREDNNVNLYPVSVP